MAAILVNGTRRASSLRVLLPRVGVWTADLGVDDGETLSGRVTVAVEGALTLVGSVLRGAVGAEVWTGRLVGGAGGLGRPVAALPHRAVTLSDVLAQALSDAGETADAATVGASSGDGPETATAPGSSANAATWNPAAVKTSRALPQSPISGKHPDRGYPPVAPKTPFARNAFPIFHAA